jgi:hypothetical protein
VFSRGIVAGAAGAKETPMTAQKVDDHVEINEEEVRSGQTGVHLRYILIVSTLMVVAAFGLVAVFAGP